MLVRGETTREQVKEVLGDPVGATFNSQGQVWTYTASKVAPGVVNFIPYVSLLGTQTSIDTQQLVVQFDQAGRVVDYVLSGSDDAVKTGIFSEPDYHSS